MYKLVIPSSKLCRGQYDGEGGTHCAMGFLRVENYALFDELRSSFFNSDPEEESSADAFFEVQRANDTLSGDERRDAIAKAFAKLGVEVEFIL